MNDQPSPELIHMHKPASKKRRLLPVLVVVGLIVGLIFLPSPIGPPATLHVWDKDFNSTGQATCWVDGDPNCFGSELAPIGPSPATPVTAQAMQQATQSGQTPYVLHLKPGILGWLFGMTDAGPKPSQRTEPIYLQVGPDAFIPYVWAHCCMPDW